MTNTVDSDIKSGALSTLGNDLIAIISISPSWMSQQENPKPQNFLLLVPDIRINQARKAVIGFIEELNLKSSQINVISWQKFMLRVRQGDPGINYIAMHGKVVFGKTDQIQSGEIFLTQSIYSAKEIKKYLKEKSKTHLNNIKILMTSIFDELFQITLTLSGLRLLETSRKISQKDLAGLGNWAEISAKLENPELDDVMREIISTEETLLLESEHIFKDTSKPPIKPFSAIFRLLGAIREIYKDEYPL